MRYLIVRPDGLLPAYPVFVLDGHDPAAEDAMRKYAHSARQRGYPNAESLFAIYKRMKSYAGTTPPPLMHEDPWIARAIDRPGGRVKLYEMQSTPHATMSTDFHATGQPVPADGQW